MSMRKEAASRCGPKTDVTAMALLGAMFLGLAAVGTISLSANGAEAFLDIVHAIGLGRTSATTTEQQSQAAIAELGRNVQTISADLKNLTARNRVTDQRDIAVSDRFALIDADIAALAAEIRAVRAAAANEPPALTVLRAATDDLRITVGDTRSEIGSLRSSLDEYAGVFRGDIAALGHRVDRLEQMAARELTGSIRTPTRRKQVRRKARPAPAPFRFETPATTYPSLVAAQPTIFAPRPIMVEPGSRR
jgi:hypothetical protein